MSDEVQFRRGELLFSAKRYAEAQQAYAAVIAHGANSSFYVQSLYKSGWSLYKESLPQRSLPVFAKLLDCELLAPEGRVRPLTDLRRADRELVEDSLRVMSIAFSDDAGAQSIDRFVGGYGVRPYDSLLYSRLGDLYVAKQRYQDAASTSLSSTPTRSPTRRRISRHAPSGPIRRGASVSSSSRPNATTSSTMVLIPRIGGPAPGLSTPTSLRSSRPISGT
jgi:tetratricopeptide (TPR) repeat protein